MWMCVSESLSTIPTKIFRLLKNHFKQLQLQYISLFYSLFFRERDSNSIAYHTQAAFFYSETIGREYGRQLKRERERERAKKIGITGYSENLRF